jgi:branched-chain amino acid transport system substrate-binding protein
MAIAEFGLEDDVELIFESIHQGTDKDLILNTANKLVLQHQTDANILFSNFLLMEEIASSLNALQKPLILSNMGGNLPNLFEPGEYIFSNTLGLWESAYLGAKWGVNKFGKKTAHGSYFYEAGYSLYSSFCRGLNEAGGEILFNQVSEFNPDPNDFANFEMQMELESPDFLYMLYSERDAVDFLNKFSQSEMNGKYPVISSGVLLNDEILDKVDQASKNVFNVSTWDASDESDENKRFIQAFAEKNGKTPNFFNVLGYECTGLVLSACESDEWARDGKSQVNALKSIDFLGPRGKLSFDEMNATQAQHKIYTIDESKKRYQIDSLGIMESRSDVINASKETANPAGWFQPYLCQ